MSGEPICVAEDEELLGEDSGAQEGIGHLPSVTAVFGGGMSDSCKWLDQKNLYKPFSPNIQ